MSPTVYVVDDDISVIKGLSNLLSAENYAVATYTSPALFLSQAEYSAPCCLIVDLNMPGIDGFGVTEALHARQYAMPTVFLTGFGTIPVTVKAMKAGAYEFLTKPVDPERLLNVVAEAMRISEQTLSSSLEQRELTKRYHSLTPREGEVMRLAISGLLNKQIAAEMGVSEITAKVHKRRMMEKMAVRSLSDLVRAAERLDIVTVSRR